MRNAIVLTLGLLWIWLIGIRDFILSRQMIDQAGLNAELNLIARWVAASFGSASLGLFKLFFLFVFTFLALWIARRNRQTGRYIVGAGVGIYALLAAWWEFLMRVGAYL